MPPQWVPVPIASQENHWPISQERCETRGDLLSEAVWLKISTVCVFRGIYSEVAHEKSEHGS